MSKNTTEYARDYYQKNKERINAQQVAANASRYHTDPEYRKQKLDHAKAWKLANKQKCLDQAKALRNKNWLQYALLRKKSTCKRLGILFDLTAEDVSEPTCRIPDDHKDAYETGLAENRTSPS